MKILYEDNHILALFKPGGVPTQPLPDSSQISLEDMAKERIKKRDQKKGGVFLHAVHRLDKDTCGIVIFAKTQKALSRLMESMRNGLWKKEYVAVVHGEKKPMVGTYEDHLVHGDHRASIVSKNHPQAKKASLEVESVTPGPHDTWQLHIILHTGRYHQIRAQLAGRGFSIVGDTRYGSTRTFPQGIALSHVKVVFPHPTLKEDVVVEISIDQFLKCEHSVLEN